ncbi:MAG TPA: DoxX family protein [Actinobacteria bacterium]|jgi:uncharacterized membrane protein YphA (DoxX/SURF4 family)|nr:DoxX family protein [Actinomycetota bacterium]
MSILLWILQVLLAVMFILAGAMKAFQSYDTMARRMPWVQDYSPSMVRGIGALEILGGLGLILPGLFGLLTVLTPLAAVGLAIIMVLATFHHLRRHESGQTGFTIALLVVLLFVAWGRFSLAPL